jgi:carboxylate-amine ligase
MSLTHFDAAAGRTLGVEEELMLVDAETNESVPRVEEVLAALEGTELRARVKMELFASVVELTTPVCADAVELARELERGRSALVRAVEPLGVRVLAAGTHPLSVAEEQEIVPEQRYQEFLETIGPAVRRQGVNGVHVHVGVPDGDACVRALEWLLPWLPVTLALSANSPYIGGVETGYRSTRAELLSQLPRAGLPPRIGSFARWEALVERLAALGIAPDATRYWWDVRPHPSFGTLEVRVPDQQTDVRRSIAFAALVQALVAVALEQPPRPERPGDRIVVRENRYRAALRGLDAELAHPDKDSPVPARELAGELLELVRPAARALGSEPLLEPLASLEDEASRQLEIGGRDGLAAVCADLVERSVPKAT